MRDWLDDFVFGAIVLALLGIIAGFVVWLVLDYQHANQINDNFTKHCNSLGGHAIISEKDLCVSPNGRILDHEG